MIIQKAIPDDHVEITIVCKKSKAYWGYSAYWMQLWEKELTIKPQYMAEATVYKLLFGEQIIAFYSFLPIDQGTVELENLFILPHYIGQGIGRLLLDDFFARSKQAGFSKVRLDADPNAESFYSYFGFVSVGKRPTLIEGRYLPIMEKII